MVLSENSLRGVYFILQKLYNSRVILDTKMDTVCPAAVYRKSRK